MEVIRNINFASLLDTLISFTTAFVLGGLIGFERQYRQRTAGLRTNMLVCLGAAIFVDLANRVFGPEGTARVTAYVVSGIGFLGAGVIMRNEGGVRGLNTAATLWCSAAVGACAGADLILEAILATFFVLATNTVMRPVVNKINRTPLDAPGVEATTTIYVIVPAAQQKQALKRLEEVLEEARYPTSALDLHPFGADGIEIEAVLAGTSIDGEELDTIVERLSAEPFVRQAFWNTRAAE